MVPYVEVFLATALTVFAVTPLVRLLSRRMGAIVQPSGRMVHVDPIPTMGGLAMVAGVVAGIVASSFIPQFRGLFKYSELRGVLMASLVIAAVGAVDDVRSLSAPAKVAGQVLSGGLLYLNGVALLFFYFPTQGTVLLGSDLSVPLTIAWVLVVVNAVNLIDGLDGLAAGIVVIAGGAFFVYAYRSIPTAFFPETAPTAPLISMLAAGAAAGFLPYNFHPARIIMGDTGSMLLGLLLAAATISGVGQSAVPTGHNFTAFLIPVVIPVLVLALPLMDVILAVIRRLRRHRKWYAPDKEHIHHQLMEIGHTHRQAVLLMYLWSAVVAGSTLAITYASNRATIVAVIGFVALVIAVTVVPRVIRAVRKSHAEARAEGA